MATESTYSLSLSLTFEIGNVRIGRRVGLNKSLVKAQMNANGGMSGAFGGSSAWRNLCESDLRPQPHEPAEDWILSGSKIAAQASDPELCQPEPTAVSAAASDRTDSARVAS
jgi:hypothetical protein